MRKKLLTFGILIVLILTSLIFTSYLLWQDPYFRERKSLSSELGVNISDYPERGFPINYFEEVLVPGTSSDEVHQIIKGYKKVMLCDTNAEFYYYFSTDDNKAERFLVFFDEKGKLRTTMSEDVNSRYLQHFVSNCVPGRIDE